MKADILREKFLNFFKAKKHRIIESDSLVPKEDPTVLFTPAGMNQFKKQFLGEVGEYNRAATSQRCLRTDDLDKVGKTTGHHTFFEMLGNFSFGNYFKKEAIQWAWEFLTKELKINENKLWVSVYKDDDEAYKIWKDIIGVSVNKIIKLGDKDNFWPAEAKEKGPNGPCGPCSEIFYDFGKNEKCKNPGCNPACSCGRFVEIWNLVFTQFNRKEGGILEPLPQKNIDTGMGLERLTAVMQGAPNNFETDLFRPILDEIGRIDNTLQKTLRDIEVYSSLKKEYSYAIADHLRAVVFSIYDGILPSNEGRGYVVRKIIRKSALALRQLGEEKPFLYKLVPVLAEIMKVPYPELLARREDIAQIIQAEEKNFAAILNSSDKYLKDFINVSDPEEVASRMFVLTDTHGLPLEIITDWFKKHRANISQKTLDLYNKKLLEQKNRSKSQSNMKGDVFASEGLKLDVTATKFAGYKNLETSGKVLAIIKDGKQAKKAGKEEVKIVLDKTSLYAESGGQVGDTGILVKGKNVFEVTDTVKSGKIFFHIGKVKAGTFKKSDLVTAKVDKARRLSIGRNHTATHLLQAALRQVLGVHVQQQGSLVEAERLRFDFSHFKGLSEDEISRVEELVNSYILANHVLSVKEMALTNAKKTGALAFFAEKYEGKVRVISIGDFSREFCGGTHLESSGQIGLFKIISESSVASGIRRIEAVTGDTALKLVKEEGNIINDVAGLLNVGKDKITIELEKRLSRIKELEKQLNSQKANVVRSSVDEFIQAAVTIGDIKLIAKVIPEADMAALRSSVDLIKQKSPGLVVALASSGNGRALLVVGLTADLVEKGLDASLLMGKIASFIGGSGGGRKDFAQAGGNNPAGLDAAFREMRNIIAHYA